MLITCTLYPEPHQFASSTPRVSRSRGLARGARGTVAFFLRRSVVAADLEAMVLGHVLTDLRYNDVRANYDLPAILQALGALGCASSLEYLFETLRDHSHPVTLVFERSGTGILLHDAEAGGGECSACSNPATDSPVP